MASLTWLHLSDWHQRGRDFNRQRVVEQLLKDVENRSRIDPRLTQLDFMVFSGDVAFSGQPEEYEAAVTYLFKPILEVVSLDPSRLFIIPGNHDVDQTVFELLPDTILRPFTEEEVCYDWLTEDRKRQRILEPFTRYREFVEGFTGHTGSEYGFTWKHEVAGKQVALIGLNSALMSGRHKGEKGLVNDYGQLIVGEPQLSDALKAAGCADVRIAVIHHPFDWLITTDTMIEKSRIHGMLTRECHFILRGHEHEPIVTFEAGTLGDCVTIAAGACYYRREPPASRYANGYNYVHLDFLAGEGIAFLRRYEDRHGWIKDTGATGDETPGYRGFRLPKDLSSQPLESPLPTTGMSTAVGFQSTPFREASGRPGGAILTNREIQAALEQGRITIDPRPEPSQYSTVSVNLKLGSEFRRWTNPSENSRTVIDPTTLPQDSATDLFLEHGRCQQDGSIIVGPGDFLLAVTSERIELPMISGIVAWLDGRRSLSRLGLMVSVGSSSIPLGFRGHVTLEIENRGCFPIVLRPGMEICQIIFEFVSGASE
jgi:deoxycytidine triphosphate deaminase